VRGQRHAPAALYPREKPGTHFIGGWVGPKTGLDRCGKYLPTPVLYPRTVRAVDNVISIVLYHSVPTFGQVLYCCQDAFVVASSDYSGHLIRHILSASEAFPTEWFLQFWEQIKGWWAHVRTVRQVGKHLPSILFQNFRYCT